MSKPLLIWENGVFPDKEKEVVAKYFDIRYFEFFVGKPEDLPPFAFRGSTNASQRLKLNTERFSTRKWVPYLEDYMISRPEWQTAKGVTRFKDYTWPLFIRPDSGKKIFSGQVFTKEKWLEEFNYLKQRNAEKIIVFCSRPTNLGREWRCLFVGEKLVGVSDYMLKGEILGGAGRRNITDKLLNLAQEIRKNDFFTPEDNVTIDIAQREDGSYGLIEINFLESSGWYACDPEPVYQELAKQFE